MCPFLSFLSFPFYISLFLSKFFSFKVLLFYFLKSRIQSRIFSKILNIFLTNAQRNDICALATGASVHRSDLPPRVLVAATAESSVVPSSYWTWTRRRLARVPKRNPMSAAWYHRMHGPSRRCRIRSHQCNGRGIARRDRVAGRRRQFRPAPLLTTPNPCDARRQVVPLCRTHRSEGAGGVVNPCRACYPTGAVGT